MALHATVASKPSPESHRIVIEHTEHFARLIGNRDGHSFATQRIVCLIVGISLRPSTLNGKSDSDISSVSVGDTGAKSDRTACKRASSVQSAQSTPTPSRIVSTDGAHFSECGAFCCVGIDPGCKHGQAGGVSQH
jgi:hypothetical protein